MNNFCLKIKFSEAQHAISEFCFFFKDRRFFLCYFFLICFHRSPPPQFVLRMKRFASIKDSSRVSAPCDLPETFFKKFSKNFEFFSLFFFFQCFRLREMVFCCFQLGKNGFRDLCVSLRVFFGAVELMKNNVILHLVLCMILLIWFSSKVRNLLRKCLRSTASPLC